MTEEIFRYDLNYIDQNMGWKKPAKTNVDAAVLTANLNPIKPPGLFAFLVTLPKILLFEVAPNPV